MERAVPRGIRPSLKANPWNFRGLTVNEQPTGTAQPARQRADVLSSFYVICYLGTGLPVIGVGFLATVTSLLTTVQCFAVVTALLCAAMLLALARHRSRPA